MKLKLPPNELHAAAILPWKHWASVQQLSINCSFMSISNASMKNMHINSTLDRFMNRRPFYSWSDAKLKMLNLPVTFGWISCSVKASPCIMIVTKLQPQRCCHYLMSGTQNVKTLEGDTDLSVYITRLDKNRWILHDWSLLIVRQYQQLHSETANFGGGWIEEFRPKGS